MNTDYHMTQFFDSLGRPPNNVLKHYMNAVCKQLDLWLASLVSVTMSDLMTVWYVHSFVVILFPDVANK